MTPYTWEIRRFTEDNPNVELSILFEDGWIRTGVLWDRAGTFEPGNSWLYLRLVHRVAHRVGRLCFYWMRFYNRPQADLPHGSA